MSIRGRLRDLRTWWRRQRLLRAYSRVFKARTGKSVGFTPTMYAIEAADRDGLLELDEDGVTWTWPHDEDSHASAKPDLIVRSHPCHGTLYCLWNAEETGAAPFGREPSERRSTA